MTLPPKARRQLRMKEGDYVRVRVTDDGIVLTPQAMIDKSQVYFWTPEWQAAALEASADIAADRVRVFDNVDDLVVSLRSQSLR